MGCGFSKAHGDRTGGGTGARVSKWFQDPLPELFLVKEINPEITVFVAGCHRREPRIQSPLHADDFSVRLREVRGVREREVARDLLLQRQARLRQRRTGGESRIDLQLVDTEYTLETIRQRRSDCL